MNDLGEYPGLVQDEGTCGGKVRLDGHRLSVSLLADWHWNQQLSIDEIAEMYKIDTSAIAQAIRYAHHHRTEIERLIAENNAA